MPVVLKADGLALGKGVLICNTPAEARDGRTHPLLPYKKDWGKRCPYRLYLIPDRRPAPACDPGRKT